MGQQQCTGQGGIYMNNHHFFMTHPFMAPDGGTGSGGIQRPAENIPSRGTYSGSLLEKLYKEKVA